MNLKIHTFVVQFRRELSALCAGLTVLISLNVLRPHPQVSVIAAAHDLPAGHVIQQEDVSRISLTSGWPSAMTNGNDVVGHTVTHAVASGTPLSRSDLLDTSTTKNLSDGMRAVTIEISATESTLAQIGSHVDVFSADGQQVSADSLVLAINIKANTLSLGASSTPSIVVAMNRSEVSQFASARTSGALTVAVSSD